MEQNKLNYFLNLRKDFLILNQDINNNKLTYLDNASTSQKPKQVLDTLFEFYTKNNANISRGVYTLGEKATDLYEKSREIVAKFINADYNEIVFTKNCTESINFVSCTWAEQNIKSGDEIVITDLEHHSNILPWQNLALKKNINIKFIPVNLDGTLNLTNIDNIFTKKTKLVSIVHTSNALGVTNDIEFITKKAHSIGAKVLIDAAQSIAHQKIDVKKINADFLVFSGHKILAPTGIGVLFIKKDLHDQMPPYQFGGGMVLDVSKQAWKSAPDKFEAGTPPIAQAIALARAIKYLQENINFQDLKEYEANLCSIIIDEFKNIPEIRLLGPLDQLKKSGHLISFVFENIHAHDIASYLDQHGICVRAGNYCAQPLAEKLNITASVRTSFYFYNTQEEIEKFVSLIKNIKNKF